MSEVITHVGVDAHTSKRGPCGYALQRADDDLARELRPVGAGADSAKPGERVKTNRRDGHKLVELGRAGLLTAVQPPTPEDNAVRDLVSAENVEKRAEDTHMTKPEISGIAPFFIVKNVPAAMSFYRDRLGFDITFQGPSDDDIFFGIVQRGAAMIMLKDVGVDPVPNYTRDIKKGIARWDAYLHIPDPDALAAEFSARNVEFFQPLKDDEDGLRGFEVKDADGYVLFFGRPRS